MRCSCAQCRFSAYLDRDLDPDDEAELREHLAQCSECSAELEAMKRCLNAVHELPGSDPGADFYDCVCRRIHEAGEHFSGEKRGRSLLVRWLPDLSAAWLRPALGAALGIVAGVLLTAHSPQVASLAGGASAEREMLAAQGFYERTAEQIAESRTDGSPLAGIELPPLRSAVDSVNVAPEPEYVLAPYVSDPHGGLVPAGGGYGRTASTELDSQSDVFVTF